MTQPPSLLTSSTIAIGIQAAMAFSEMLGPRSEKVDTQRHLSLLSSKRYRDHQCGIATLTRALLFLVPSCLPFILPVPAIYA